MVALGAIQLELGGAAELDLPADPGMNVGLKMYPNASAAWATIRREIKAAAARQ